jgi:REP-associated tyrosine transposase
MEQESDIRYGRHCIFKMHVHLVFVTKYRRRVFDAAAIDALRDIFQSVCRDFEATLVEMDGEDDHVHLLIEYPPKVPVSSLVNSLKGVSSRLLRQGRPDIRKRYWRGSSGPQATLPPPAAVRLSPLSASTSSSRKLRIRRPRRHRAVSSSRYPSPASMPELSAHLGNCRTAPTRPGRAPS